MAIPPFINYRKYSILYFHTRKLFLKDEIIEIDNRGGKNREAVRKLPSNSKRKAKRFIPYIVFIFMISRPLVPCAAAVVMLLLPIAIHRLSPIEQDRILSNKNSYPQIAHILEEKVDKIRLTNEQIKQFNNLAIELNSGSITMEEAVKAYVENDAYWLKFYHFAGEVDTLLHLKMSCGTKTIYLYTLKQVTPAGFIFLSKREFSLFLN